MKCKAHNNTNMLPKRKTQALSRKNLSVAWHQSFHEWIVVVHIYNKPSMQLQALTHNQFNFVESFLQLVSQKWAANCKPPSPLGFVVIVFNDSQLQTTIKTQQWWRRWWIKSPLMMWQWWERKRRENSIGFALSNHMILSLSQMENLKVAFFGFVGFYVRETGGMLIGIKLA